MFGLCRGKYAARLAQTEQDVRACQKLRARVFRGASVELDADTFDVRCSHVLVECAKTSNLVACFRLLELTNGSEPVNGRPNCASASSEPPTTLNSQTAGGPETAQDHQAAALETAEFGQQN